MALSKVGSNQIDDSIALGELDVDNVKVNGNTISSTDTNGNINLDPDGTGNTVVAGVAEINSGSSACGLVQTSTVTHSGVNLRNSDNNNGFINYDSSGNDSIRMFVDNGAGSGTFKTFQSEAETNYIRGPIRMAEAQNLQTPYETTGDGRNYKNVMLAVDLDAQDHWIVRDYAGGTANWGIYYRNVNSDLTSSGNPRVSGNSVTFMGNTSAAMNIDLADGVMRTKGSWLNGYQGAAYDRGWNSAPSITVFQNNSAGVTNTGSNGFRIHGASGNWYDWDISGAPAGGPGDFSINLVIDGSYTTSDERKKTNIADLDDGLALINQLRPRTFSLTTSELEVQEGFENCYGYVAQEVNTVFPDAVMHAEGREGIHENGWCDAYSVDYGKINVLAVRAVQQLSAKVTTLEGQVADLTARLEALEAG